MSLDVSDEIIVDSFAGGGGASTGIEMCGNSVCPPIAAALVGANCADLAVMREAAE